VVSSLAEEEESVVNVETAFARVDVVVADAIAANAAALDKSDFRVFENDKEVSVETFSKAEAPFDIVLLLDLSGSTEDKVGLIRKTTRRFIEMKRPVDRIAVVSFHDTQRIVSELESDKEVLLKRIKDINGRGASYVWDAVKFGLEILEKDANKDRRKAIVLMSDGVDNALTYTPTGSKIGFADLVEAVQYSSTAVFPIYLDTEGPNSKEVYADARKTLRYLADQSAGNMYTAKKIEDLSGIYDRVLKDVGTVYTLGFTPNDDDPEKWRRLRVELPSRPGVKLKHRPGYLIK
jgi:VWFA-related protein